MVGSGAREADVERVRRLVSADHGLAVLATTRPPRLRPVLGGERGVLPHPLTGAPVVGIVARGDAWKLKNLRHTPRATAVFRAGWIWIAVEGTVQLAGPEDGLDGFDGSRLPGLLRDIFTAAGGTHENWEEYDRVMREERRTAVLIGLDRIYGNG